MFESSIFLDEAMPTHSGDLKKVSLICILLADLDIAHSILNRQK